MSNILVAIKLVSAAIQATLSERFGIESQKGVAIIEYALLAALIAVALYTSLTGLKNGIAALFTNVVADL